MPARYARQPENSADKNEFFLVLPPGSSFNVYPTNPTDFSGFVKAGRIVESIINESLSLPPNHLVDYNDDRKWDLIAPHKDVNFIASMFEDEFGGLEVQKDREWIPVSPREGTLIVNVGYVVQVSTNDRYVSANHRVVRHSYAFFYNVGGDKCVEPPPEFTEEVPKFKGFVYKDSLQLRLRIRPEDVISIKRYNLS